MRDSLVHPAQASPPSLPELPQGRGPQLVSLLCFSQPPVAFMFSDIVMFHSLSRCARRPPQRLLPLAIPTVPFRPPIHIGALPIRNQCFTGSLPTLSDAIAVPSKRPSDSACSWSLQYFAGSPPPHPPARAPPPSRWCPATHRGARPALAPRSLPHSLARSPADGWAPSVWTADEQREPTPLLHESCACAPPPQPAPGG